MNELRYQCWTKATNQEIGAPRRSAAWVKSRRAWLKVFDDRIECGDWIIASSSIQEAVLFEMRQFLIPVYVLRLSTNDAVYQFGLNPWCRIVQHLPFEVEHRRASLGYSVFSIAIRVAVSIAAVSWLWQRFS